MDITSHNIKLLITDKAKELGFFAVGFAKYDLLEKESVQLDQWLNNGYAADMEWIKRGFEKRRDVTQILPEAKSIISLAYNYYTPFEHDESKPKISRYAWGKDYHKILKPKLKGLCRLIEEHEGVKTKAYVDDGPVMDKAWAQKAGIGWMGKHSNVINPEYGSWFFLCTIITNIEFELYNEPIEDMCGSCSLCISACPTGAITEEYIVDANKCISYQTIENRGDIPTELNLDGWIFGCDVCQNVCPYNSPKYNHITSDEGFMPTETTLPLTKGEYPPLAEEGVLDLSEEQFNEAFAQSPIKRTKYKGWKRNLERLKI